MRRRQEEQERPPIDRAVGVVSPSIDLNVSRDPIVEGLSLHHLAPVSVVRQVLEDWFNLIHPVAPILHRATFLDRFDNLNVSRDSEFTKLVISVCAAAVSTLRRRTMTYAPSLTVERCQQLIDAHEHSSDRFNVTLERCQWKYNICSALLHYRGFDSAIIQLLTSEVTSMLAHLVHYRLSSMSVLEQELTKRLYWLLYAGSW